MEPDEDYIIPLGNARIDQLAEQEHVDNGESAAVITYGMGVHWARNASEAFPGQVEILDLRTLNPLDWDAIKEQVLKHNKVLVLTEEPVMNSFAQSIAGRISSECFEQLDAPVKILGAANLSSHPVERGPGERNAP